MKMRKHNSHWARLALTFGLLFSVLPVAAAPPRLEPLGQIGKWPGFTRGPAYDVKVVGNRAYVAAAGGGLVILDVSDPANPVPMGGYDTRGQARAIAVSGTVAYLADYTNGLQIIDVSNPARPKLLRRYVTSGYATDVAVLDGIAYVADGYAGLEIIDVSNPLRPVRLGGYQASGYALCVNVSGSVAYVTDDDAGLQIIDVSNPASPVRLGGYGTSGSAHRVVVAGNRIYVADGERGLKVFCTLANVQYMMRVEGGTLGTPYTIEAATDLTEPVGWTRIFTTNPAALPFEFTDFDVRIAEHPQKFYRVRQP
jgi:uncharacterized secreted protein with C-terminal beta-propeller domain